MRYVIVFFVFCLINASSLVAFSQQPIPKIGAFCPHDYIPDGSYCMPNQNAYYAIAKVGSFCPANFQMQGDYCVYLTRDPVVAVPINGPFCPSGFRNEGDYCVK
jgi:hypothetical protein